MKIYLAGPMRGIKDFNFPAFKAAAANLRAQGHVVFDAATFEEEKFGKGFNKSERGDIADIKHPQWNFRDVFATDLEWIAIEAEAIAVLPGWERSTGAQAEVAAGRCLKLPILWADTLRPVDHAILAHFGASSSEVRVVDNETGGAKGVKLERFDLIPVEPLEEVARIYGRGAMKYPPDNPREANWAKGYPWHLSFGAMMRHAWAFWRGESIDRETGCHHLACAAWHCLTLMWFEKHRPEKDDRAK